ncbi:hypothetical protein V6Z11_A11G291900 [Gossypium hirsutum]
MERQEKFRPSFLPCFGSRYATTELESWKGQSFRLVVGTFLCNCVIEVLFLGVLSVADVLHLLRILHSSCE